MIILFDDIILKNSTEHLSSLSNAVKNFFDSSNAAVVVQVWYSIL